MRNASNTSNNAMLRTIAVTLLAVSTFLWGVLLTAKYYYLGYYDWDLAFHAQAMWGWAHGTSLSSLFGIHVFGDHANFIALAVFPLYKIVPHPLTLVMLMVLAFHASALSLYWISAKYLDKLYALIFCAVFLLFPPNIFANLYEFNYDCLAMLGFMWMIYFFIEQRARSFWCVTAATLLVKENMALVLIMFGLYGLLAPKRDKVKEGLWPVVAGLVVFYMLSVLVIPSLRGMETHGFVSRYRHLGGSVGEIVMSVVFNPINTLALIFDPRNVDYLLRLFGPLAPAAVLSPHILFLGLPLFLQNLLSLHYEEHMIYYHYSRAQVPFIFMAAVFTFAFLKSRLDRRICASLAILILLCTAVYGAGYMDEYKRRWNLESQESAAASWALIRQIPDDAAVIATFKYLVPLSQRKELYSFHMFYEEKYYREEKMKETTLYTGQPFELPDSVEYALIDFNDPWIQRGLYDDPVGVQERVREFFSSGSWRVVQSYGSKALYKRLGPLPGE